MLPSLDSRFRRTQSSYRSLADFLEPSPKAALLHSNSQQNITHEKLLDFVRDFEIPVVNNGSLKKPVLGVLLPNGPVLAATVLAAATWYTVAPINPAAGAEQVAADIALSGASAILTSRPEAEKLQLDQTNLGVFFVEEEGGRIQVESSEDTTLPRGAKPGPNRDDDIGIILFTSGTSGNKKVVPMTIYSIVCGVGFVIDSWALKETDVCLNMMPLYHVGGLIRNIFAPIFSGGSTVCCPGFDPNLFWDVTETMGPTWYYASPSMHTLILEEAKSRPEALAKSRIRLVCNAAGGLLPALADRLSDTFGSVVLPSYGMTECMPISTPPIDYKLERPGTSGISAGPGLAILDGLNREVPPHTVGRIAVRGEPTFKGYLRADGTLDKSPFTAEGWFDTGDMGYMDEDGYLYITGRNKEVINRGGELISPFEVENAIISAAERKDSPIWGRVSQALAFSVRHDVLQEVVGIVLVTPAGKPRVDVRLLHESLKVTLQQAKWPAVIVYMDDTPKRNGKFLRIKLGERLSLPCMTDGIPYTERHWEAKCPVPDTDLSVPLPAALCQIDRAAVQKAMDDLVDHEIDVYVETNTDHGTLEAYLAPSRSQNALVTEDMAHLIKEQLSHVMDGYLLPHRITRLPEPLPRDDEGNIDSLLLHKRLADIQVRLAVELASSTRGRITWIFANILGLEPEDITPHKDFFDLGGDSLKAGKLLSSLRSEYKMHLPVDLIFKDGSVDALTIYIDKHRRAEMAEEALTLPGCEKTYSSTNPLLLLLQLVPMVVVYPLCRAFHWSLFIYALSYAQRLPISATILGRLFILVVCMLLARIVVKLTLPWFGIAAKWIIIGRHKEGLYPMWGPYHTRWWLTQKIVDVCGKGCFELTEGLEIWYYRLLGANIGRGVTIKNAQLGEWDLVDIGDGATLDNCIARPFGAERNTSMYLGKVRIGNNASVGVSSVVAPGTTVPDDICIGPNSSSWELEDATEGNRELSATKVRSPHWALWIFGTAPLWLLAKFLYLVPWLGGLVGIVVKSPSLDGDPLAATLDWFAQGERVGYHYLARALRTLLGPFFIFSFVVLVRKSLELIFGPLKPGPARGRGQVEIWRAALMKSLMPVPQLHELTALFGQHYEATSMVIRALGGKAGRHIYWPGTGPRIGDYHLLDIGNDVVFGSRSDLVTSDGTGSGTIKVGDRAMVADRVVVLPGVTIEARTTMGSGALTRRDKTYESGGTYVGSKGGECLNLTRTTRLRELQNIDSESSDEACSAYGEKVNLDLRGSTLTNTPLPGTVAPSSPLTPSFETGCSTPNPRTVTVSTTDLEIGQNMSQPVPNKLLESRLEETRQEESEAESDIASDTGSSLSPFGRAFYNHQAPYYVLRQWQIFLYSAIVIVFVHVYWDAASLSAVQIVALIFRTAANLGNASPWDPFILFALFGGFISALASIQAVITVAITLAAKWSLLGCRQPGNYDWDKSSYCQRWQLFLTIEKMRLRCFQGYGILGMFTGTAYMVWYFRALGAEIGKDCALFVNGRPSLMLTEPDLLTLGDRVTVDDASLVGHINTRGKFDLNRLRVGDRSVLRTSSRLLSGAEMGADSCLLEHTLVMAGDIVEEGVTMQGWPASRFRASRVPSCA
ncbi:hypothetical protein DL769_001021 [Monosporascus sp. CRB-8-3]|nr:hypothetical protein DL769_001021 [Monosporascus sp. CRB-8-3]